MDWLGLDSYEKVEHPSHETFPSRQTEVHLLKMEPLDPFFGLGQRWGQFPLPRVFRASNTTFVSLYHEVALPQFCFSIIVYWISASLENQNSTSE
jgi:hypothetical protein